MITNDQQFVLNLLQVSYQKADILIRSKFSLNNQQQHEMLQEAIRQGFNDLIVLSTCNRTELISSASKEQLSQLLLDFSRGTLQDLQHVSTVYQQQQAVYHLYKMGTGLDSQIIGDREIVGQLRNAFELSQNYNLVNPFTIRLIPHVIHTSKSIKNVTNLSSGTTSVSYAAVQYLKQHYTDLSQVKVLIVGLGKMGNHTAINLIHNTPIKQLKITNRSDQKTKQIAQLHNSLEFIPFAQLAQAIKEVDVIIMSTSGSQDILLPQHLDQQPKLILDLSLPSNVAREVIALHGVTYVDIDQLSIITNNTIESRKESIPKALEIIAKATHEFYQWLDFRQYAQAANSFKYLMNNILHAEIEYQKRKNKYYDSSDLEFIVGRMNNKITSQIIDFFKTQPDEAAQAAELINKIFGKS